MKERSIEITGGSLYYTVVDEHIMITRLAGLTGEVTIPSQIEGMPVTGIDKKAFLSKKALRRITLPQSIETIGDWAFAYCDHLKVVNLSSSHINFGKSLFLDCGELTQITANGQEEQTSFLMAAAVTVMEAPYLLCLEEAGTPEWLEKWDVRLLTLLHRDDQEGYAKQVLCGEEDYGSTDLNAYLAESRRKKIRLLLLRLLHPACLADQVKIELKEYLREHTSGCASDETWQVIWKEHGNEQSYYKLFVELECLSTKNLPVILNDIGEEFPEMKAYFLSYNEKETEGQDFFAALDLDF